MPNKRAHGSAGGILWSFFFSAGLFEGKTICHFHALIFPSFSNFSFFTSKEVVGIGKHNCRIWMFCFTFLTNKYVHVNYCCNLAYNRSTLRCPVSLSIFDSICCCISAG